MATERRGLPHYVTIYLRSATVWAQARRKAASQGASMSRVVELLVQAYVNGEVVVRPPELENRR